MWPAALVAQLDRAPDYGSGGWGFESLRARYLNPSPPGEGFLDWAPIQHVGCDQR